MLSKETSLKLCRDVLSTNSGKRKEKRVLNIFFSS